MNKRPEHGLEECPNGSGSKAEFWKRETFRKKPTSIAYGMKTCSLLIYRQKSVELNCQRSECGNIQVSYDIAWRFLCGLKFKSGNNHKIPRLTSWSAEDVTLRLCPGDDAVDELCELRGGSKIIPCKGDETTNT